MKTVAIIAEYNPLHAGHRHHFEQSLRRSQATHSLILMSGNFVQRGEPAIFDKYTRAISAIEMGADLVLELPFIYATSSAQYFAEGAVRMLEQSGIVDYLSFGSESGDIEQLQLVAKKMLEPEHASEIKAFMNQGLSYAQAVDARLNFSNKAPNDILAVQYLRALIRQQSHITPLAIPRQGAYHDETWRKSYPSATAIRKAIRRGDIQPQHQPLFWEDLENMFYSRLLLDDLTPIHGMREGIDHALTQATLQCYDLPELIEACRTPRFSQARLKRLLLHSLLHYTATDHAELQGTYYFRPLAFNTQGRRLLRHLKQKQPEYFIPTLARYQGSSLTMRALEFDVRSSNLYYHFIRQRPEQSRKPIYVR